MATAPIMSIIPFEFPTVSMKRTRMKRVTETHSKRRRAAQSRKTRQRMVNLRGQIERWKILLDEQKCQNDAELAEMLIDSYLLNRTRENANVSVIIKTEPQDEDDQHSNVIVPSRRESENLHMDCESIIDEDVVEVHRGKSTCASRSLGKKQSGLVDFHYIHGIPVYQPFTLHYTSPSIDRGVESKVYIIVEHTEEAMDPFKIDVLGDIHEVSSGGFQSKIFQDFKKSSISSYVDLSRKMDVLRQSIVRRNHDGCKTLVEGPMRYPNKLKKKDRDGKFEIIADILDDLMDSVVKQDHLSDGVREHVDEGGESSKRKRKRRKDSSTVKKKQKMIMLEDSVGENTPHSSRIRSKGYRINYANLNEFSSGESDMSDDVVVLDEDGEDNETMNEEETEPVTDNSNQHGQTIDPDYDPTDSNQEESPKKSKGQKKCKDELDENHPDKITTVQNNKEKKIESIKKEPYKERLAKERQQRRLLKQKDRISVILCDHTDKFYLEEQVSIEMKDRGKADFEKSYQLMVCALCHKFRTEDKRLIESHLEYHINGDFTCQKCDFEAVNLHEIRMHNHKNHSKMKQCKLCSTKESPVTFRNDKEHKDHYIEFHRDRLYQCVHCGMYYLTRTLLGQHHCVRKLDLPDIQCDLCGKEMRPYSLNAHKKNVHFNVRPFPCSYCKYSGRTQAKLQEHVQAKHEGVHNHKCDHCDFTCVRPSQLVSHKRTHTGDKPYKCDQCPYAAAWNVQLKEHKKLHEGMASLGRECEICGVIIKEGAAFTKHLKKEHGREHI